MKWRKIKTHAPSLQVVDTWQGYRPFLVQTYADLDYYYGSVAKWFSFSQINGQDMILDDITDTVIFFVDELAENGKGYVRPFLSEN